MAKKHKPEEIVAKLRQVDVVTSQGTPIVDAIRSIGVTEVTYYRWRNEYGGLKSDQVKRLDGALFAEFDGPAESTDGRRWTGARIHILHISSADELRPLREAKARGVDIAGDGNSGIPTIAAYRVADSII
jgi:hypothetical protein